MLIFNFPAYDNPLVQSLMIFYVGSIVSRARFFILVIVKLASFLTASELWVKCSLICFKI
jgi:hypothetical protein